MELRPASSVGTQLGESNSLHEENVFEIEDLQQELREAHEEIHSLRSDAEEASSVRENEVSTLQEELSQVKAKLEQAQHDLNDCHLEITSLRAEIHTQEPGTRDRQPSLDLTVTTSADKQSVCASKNTTSLQEEIQSWKYKYQELKDEYDILQQSNNLAVHFLERKEVMKYRTRSKEDDSTPFESESEESIDCTYFSRKRTSLQTGSSISFKPPEVVGYGSDYEEDSRMSPLEEEESDLDHDLLQLGTNMDEWEEEAALVQELRHNQDQNKLREMESKYPVNREEWERLQEELRLCKEEIERLNGTIPIGGRVPVGGLKPVLLFAVLAGGLLLYPCLKRCSSPPF